MNRRGFITGLITLVAAPAIVRVASIMPVKSYIDTGFTAVDGGIGFSLTSAEYTAYYARLKAYTDAAGVWEKIDALYIYDSPSPLTNWRSYES